MLPLPIVIAGLRWVDRYEPEPKGLLLFAFFWGATVAALIAAVLNTASAIIVARTSDAGQGMATTAVLVAPWVEEAAKGAAVLGVFLFRRKEFDGIVDGIVLAGFTGFGFAFTENILYFGRAFLAGNEELGVTGGLFAAGITFVLRGVLAPFAHPLFTTMTGIGLGIAVHGRPGAARLLAPIGGYLAGGRAARHLELLVAVRTAAASLSATSSSWCRCSWSPWPSRPGLAGARARPSPGGCRSMRRLAGWRTRTWRCSRRCHGAARRWRGPSRRTAAAAHGR